MPAQAHCVSRYAENTVFPFLPSVLRPPVANQLQHIWNSLPNCVVSADSINYKSRLDKFWKSYDFLHDYKAQPYSTGSQK